MVFDLMGKPVGYSAEERQGALDISLCSVASSLGYTPVRAGAHYSLKEMDSLIIYNDRTWNRWSGKGNINGGTQIDFLMEFGGVDSAPEAIKWLLDYKGSPVHENIVRKHQFESNQPFSEEKKEMVLPPKNENFRRLYAYLIQTRGLSQEVVSDFVHRKLIYEDAIHHNIVFCGYDPQGAIRYAGMRGTADLYGKKFKMDVKGNDKNYGVNIVNKDSVDLCVFESVIDCMSFIDLFHNEPNVNTNINMLVLGMVEDNPLAQFIKDYDHIKNIHFCLDNDEAACKALYGKNGNLANPMADGLVKKYETLGFNVNVIEPPSGKDFNEALLNEKNALKNKESINPTRKRGR